MIKKKSRTSRNLTCQTRRPTSEKKKKITRGVKLEMFNCWQPPSVFLPGKSHEHRTPRKGKKYVMLFLPSDGNEIEKLFYG